jgi:hypothetical protein
MSSENADSAFSDKPVGSAPASPRRHYRQFAQVVLLLLILSLGVFVIITNVKEIFDNPILGVNVIYFGRTKLIREVEGVDRFSKQELINLDRGNGMRFLAFARQCVSEDSVLVFPIEQLDPVQQDTVLGAMPAQHFVVTLYPRRFLTEKYDFHRMPSDDPALLNREGRFRMFARAYRDGNKLFMFRIFASPNAHRYRFFMTDVAVTGQKDYGSELTFLLYPDGDR